MQAYELDSSAQRYFELLKEIEQLQAEAESIKDGFKSFMLDRESEDLIGHSWRASWHNTNLKRFDTKRFKADHSDLYTAYTISTTGTRFTLNQIGA